MANRNWTFTQHEEDSDMVIQPRGISIDVPNVYCGSSKLDITPAAKYLGVYIDSDLS